MLQELYSQKIGLVLSGGGGSGLAHIGVLKALEENNIPIDYIAGTSMGACVAGLYAAGYSPEQIEQIAISPKFQKWAKGSIDQKMLYFIKQSEPSPSIININFNFDSIETNLPTNFINSAPIDFGLMELMAPANAAAGGNFDSLMIPFRCVAANITDREQKVFKKGNLATAIRASMAYPFYLKPISMNGDLLFDGGLYNNFPADIMCGEFHPDILIGSNVSSNFQEPSEDNLLSQLRSMLSKDTKYKLPCGKGIIIEPEIPNDIGVFDFRKNAAIIDSGYVGTMRMMDSIKDIVGEKKPEKSTSEKRKEFNRQKAPLVFGKTKISGLHPRQTKYLLNQARSEEGSFSKKQLHEIYMKLISDDKIKSIYPTANFNSKSGNFDLALDIKKDKHFTASFGGLISTKPISTGFFELKYQNMGATGIEISGNTYFGKLYNSANAKVKWDIPFSIPFYMESNLTINHFDYFESFSTLVEEVRPSYLIISEKFADLSINLPVMRKGKISIGATLFEQEFEYYQTKDFERSDTADLTFFEGFSTFAQYERNSLNRKMYATEGSRLLLSYRSTIGDEKTIPGSTASTHITSFDEHSWFSIKMSYEQYFLRKSFFKIGALLEAIYSDQPYFNNYTATVLSAPAFLPLPESKTLFQGQYRAMKYFAGGAKFIYCLSPKIDFRLESYLFQPYEELLETDLQQAKEGTKISVRDYILSFSTVYHTGIGPLGLNMNYYENTENPFSILFHFGYILFNKRALQ